MTLEEAVRHAGSLEYVPGSIVREIMSYMPIYLWINPEGTRRRTVRCEYCGREWTEHASNGRYQERYEDAFEDCTKVLAKDALALLKAREAIEARLNLCDSCTKEYAECEADKDDLVYGNGVGNDNIIGCPWYVNRWKAQEPVEPIPTEDYDWICGACNNSVVGTEELDEGGFTPIQFNYCPNCGQAVKWE